MITAAALAAPDAVQVLRLRLRGPPETAARVRMALAPVDPPPQPPGQVVLVRRISAGRADAGMAERLRAAIAERVAAAVPADRADPARDEAVVFPSIEALLARLLADLLAGRAAGCWWWDGFAAVVARPMPAAVAAVLAEAGLRLGGVAAALAAEGRLAATWAALPAAEAGPLGFALAAQAGLDWPPAPGGAPATERVALPPALLARWRPALASLHPRDPRRQLAALALALEAMPLRLQRGAAGAILAAVGAALAGDDRPAAAPWRKPAIGPAEPPPESSLPAGRADAAPGREAGSAAPPDLSDRPGPASPTQDAVAAWREPMPGTAGTAEPTGQPAASAGAGQGGAGRSPPQTTRGAGEASVPAPASGPGAGGEARPGAARNDIGPDEAPAGAAAPADPLVTLHTAHAGTLFLVNALVRLGAGEALLAAPEEGAGWRLLRALAHGLGLPPEDPLDRFLLARVRDTGGDAVPTHPLAPAFAERAAALFGELWAPGLIAAPGRLYATPTHLDLVLPAGALRLGIRLAGLDIDPGWVPWLGRVVAFRYEGLPSTTLEQPR